MTQGLGLVQIYTGDGKGKTTAALGLCLRAAGRGIDCSILQFIKAEGKTGELASLARFGPDEACSCGGLHGGSDERETRVGTIQIRQLGTAFRFIRGEPSKEDIQAAKEGFEEARRELVSGRYRLVVLDELNTVLKLGLLSADEVIRGICDRAKGVEVVVTGRGAPEALISIADLVSEIRSVRHPYEAGVSAREGIEY